MQANEVKRYINKNLPTLKKLAEKHFNSFIRDRDKDKGCISCGAKVEHAGHFYSAGHYPGLRFLEDNVHGQCLRCNNFLHGNLIEYRKRLIIRIGIDRVEALDRIVAHFNRVNFKWDKFTLIEIIIKYRTL